jgi:hypothetical protein
LDLGSAAGICAKGIPRYVVFHYLHLQSDSQQHVSARGALNNNELDVMKATFSGRFGADLFLKMV